MKKMVVILRKKQNIISFILILIIVFSIYFIFFRNKEKISNTITVHPKTFIQKLSVSGNVEAAQKADLGFAQSGRISGVYASVGDFVKEGTVLSKIENGDLEAVLLQKESVLQKEKSNLLEKKQGTRVEQIEITEQKYIDALTAYAIALHTGYFQIQEALLIKSDTLFTNPVSVSPSLKIPANSWSESRSIENKRLVVGEKLKVWKDAIALLDAFPMDPNKQALSKAQIATGESLRLVKDLNSDLSRIVADLNTGLGYSQATIDTYVAAMSDASLLISGAASTINIAESALNSAKNSLSLDQAGSTRNDVDAQTSTVRAAEADVLNAKAQLDKSIIKAPFDGIITKMEARVGEIATSNTSSISINSNGIFQIKSNIPEVYISSLRVGNMATATLDAYGTDVTFPLNVIAIDPAETIVNGVSNYKATLQFLSIDDRIRPGMTANIDITTREIPNTFVVPQGVVVLKDGQQFVQIKNGNDIVTKPVVVGTTSSIGEVNIIAGLTDGDMVLLNPSITTK